MLYRYFTGEISADEKEFVKSWVAESADNRLKYEKAHAFYLDMKATANIGEIEQPYDVEKAWERVKKKRSSKDKPRGIQLKISYRFLRLAAAVVLLIGASWFAYERQSEPDQVIASTSNEVQKEILSDGSMITLNKQSELKYPDEFIGKERRVLLKGEAFFDIAHNPKKPFVIVSDQLELKVLGTSFNVNAVSNDSTVVTVDTGKVLMTSIYGKQIIAAGSTGVFYKSTQQLMMIKTNPVGAHNYWRTKLLSFNGSTLHEVVKVIESSYPVDVKLSNEKLRACKITVLFEDEPVKNILDVIAITLNLEVVEENGSFILSGDGCN